MLKIGKNEKKYVAKMKIEVAVTQFSTTSSTGQNYCHVRLKIWVCMIDKKSRFVKLIKLGRKKNSEK